jgi:enoyl-CoA hydratase/carnithine racemase
VIAAANATFLDPHVSVGQASVYETIALAKKSAMEAVLRMALLGRGERMTAARAYALGIVSDVIDPPEQLRAAAQDLAEQIALQPAEELAAIKRALWSELERTP